MADNFAFLLPVMMGTFSAVFFLLAWFRLEWRSALAWGIAFSTGAAAFSIGLLPVPPQWQALIADFLFFVSFYAYGQGLLLRFDKPTFAALRIGLIGVSMAADAYVLFVVQSLEMELLLVDFALAILLLIPVIAVMRAPRHIVDKALVTIAALVVLDTVVRVVLFNLVLPMSDAIGDFNASQYAFFMQISGGALGLCFALAALGSLMVDLISGYRDAAERDPLTGLYNRRGFEDTLSRLPPATLQRGVVLTCDIDHFKHTNDTYGHASGDRVLESLARMLTGSLPGTAVVARFGGEEFIACIPGVTLAEGKVMAQTICASFAKRQWSSLGISGEITVSIGLAPLTLVDRSIHDAISRADKALYLAKAAGRNQVVAEVLVPLASPAQTAGQIATRSLGKA